MRDLKGIWKILSILIVSFWVVFVVYTAIFGSWHPILQGAVFLSLGLSLIFLNVPIDKSKIDLRDSKFINILLYGRNDCPAILDVLMVIASIITCSHILFSWDRIIVQSWEYQMYELFFSGILVILVLEATRRTSGIIIPIIVSIFIIYALFGHLIPGRFGHPGFALFEILYHFYMKSEGIWGLITDTVCRILSAFLLLGPVLLATGAGKSFMNISRFVGGRMTGGAGQIAVISSAIFGTVSGSAVANVVTTGNFTIPNMKKQGYAPETAGAIEASASCGGQLMPPIMGIGAFVMAQIIGIRYLSIVVAAIIPALFYFFGSLIGVYFTAKKNKLGRLPKNMIPKAIEVFNFPDIFKLFVPLSILFYIIFKLFPPQMGAALALLAAIVLFILYGKFSYKDLRVRLITVGKALYSGAIRSLAYLIVMCVCVQMGVSLISLTGLSIKMSAVMINLAGVSIMLSLIAAMLITFILGMGMPTTAAYIIGASVLASPLINLGIPILNAHFFIFYFSVLSNITPPVCVAVYAAVSIAGGNWIKMAMKAITLSTGAYLVPYIIIFYPSILMKGSTSSIIFAAFIGFLATLFLTAAFSGYLIKTLKLFDRIILVIGTIFIIVPNMYIRSIGVGFIILVCIKNLFIQKNV